MRNDVHHLNNYSETARARAKIATDGTPLQYAHDGEVDRRRMFWLHVTVWAVMLGLAVVMIVATHGNLHQ